MNALMTLITATQVKVIERKRVVSTVAPIIIKNVGQMAENLILFFAIKHVI